MSVSTVEALLTALGSHLDLVVMIVMAVLGYMGMADKVKTWLTMNKIREAAAIAYEAANQIARKTDIPAVDLTAHALGVFVNALDLMGVKPTEQAKSLAKMMWTQMHERDTRAGVDAKTLCAQRALRMQGLLPSKAPSTIEK
jgi:hypothetical protein